MNTPHKCPDTGDAAKYVIFIIGAILIMGIIGTFILTGMGKIAFPQDQFWALMAALATGIIALLATTGRKVSEAQEVQVVNSKADPVNVEEAK